jgi:hypothetical protein
MQESYNVHRFIFQPFSNSGKSARTGNLASSVRTIPIVSVPLLVPGTIWEYIGI